jgi:hypothetical protein
MKIITKELFPEGSHFPSTKTISYDLKNGGMELIVKYSPTTELIQGLPTDIARYVINKGNPEHDKFTLIIRVSNNIHQIPGLESSEL